MISNYMINLLVSGAIEVDKAHGENITAQDLYDAMRRKELDWQAIRDEHDDGSMEWRGSNK